MRIILPLFLLCSSAFAQSNPIASSYRDFTGGLNNDDASVSLQPNESPNLMNVVIDEAGLTQRKGYLTCGNTPSGNTATNLFEYSKNDGSRSLIVTDNITVWQTPDCVQFSTITTGLSETALPRFAIVQDKLWIVNGSTWPITWDGTTATSLDGQGGRPTGPKGKYILYWKSRVWIGNTPTSPSGVYFTALTDSDGTILDPAASTMAWANTNNLIYYERDSGSPIYGMKIFRDNLYIWKENLILRTIFESEYTANGITVGKTASKTGGKFNESIVEMDDGFLRFVGQDGVYRFDGANIQRLSTKWSPTFDTIKQPTRAESYKLWDTPTDWLIGTLTDVSTISYSGSISLATDLPVSNLVDNFSDGNYTASPAWTPSGTNLFVATPTFLTYGNTYYSLTANETNEGFLVYASSYSEIGTTYLDLSAVTAYTGNGQSTGILRKSHGMRFYFLADSITPSIVNGFAMDLYCETVTTPNMTCYSTLYKCANGSCSSVSQKQITAVIDVGPTSWVDYHKFQCNYSTIVVTASSITISGTGTGTYKIGTSGTAAVDYSSSAFCSHTYTGAGLPESTLDRNTAIIIRGYQYTAPTLAYGASPSRIWGSTPTIDNIYLPRTDFKTSGSYLSQVTTATGVTIWKTFDTDQTLNNQTISYQIRTASTAANVLTAQFHPIVPGGLVSSGTLTYVQWLSSFSTTDNSVTPVLNSANIGWITGDTSKSVIYSAYYKSRYWMAASTTIGNSYNDLTMVESKTPLLTYTRFDLPLSAITLWNNNLYGAIGNTSKIARLDYGETDDGTAITSYWDSPDDVFGNPLTYKSVNRQIVDFASTPANNTIKVGLSNDLGNTWSYVTFNTAKNTDLLRNTQIINMSANNMLQFRSRIFNDKLGIGYTIYGLHAFGTSGAFAGN